MSQKMTARKISALLGASLLVACPRGSCQPEPELLHRGEQKQHEVADPNQFVVRFIPKY